MAALVSDYNKARRAMVAAARADLGYRESGSNRQKFGRRYGWDGVAWCVQAAWYWSVMGGSEGGVPKTASTGAAMRWAKSVGRWHKTPQPGDWSIMVNSRGATIHTDIVESYSGGRLICIGGNTSGTFRGSVANGNGVYRNDRTAKWKAGRIIGFVRPFHGVSVEAVKFVQGKAGIKQDGKLGPATVSAIKRLQKANGLKADGFPGPKTIATLSGKSIVEVADKTATGASKAAKKSPKIRAVSLDGRFGSNTVAASQEFLNSRGANLEIDGKAGHEYWKALSKYLGVPVTEKIVNQSYKASELGNGITQGWEYDGRGAAGDPTVRALQKWVHVEPDGIWYESTSLGLQKKLREHGAGA